MRNTLSALTIAATVALSPSVGIPGLDRPARPSRACTAPCVVSFGAGMHEDEFCYDYRGNGTLRVWRTAPDDCPVWP